MPITSNTAPTLLSMAFSCPLIRGAVNTIQEFHSFGKNLLNQAKKVMSAVKRWPTQYISNHHRLDENLLLKSKSWFAKIRSNHREWHLNQALYSEHMEGVDEETRKQLELVMLHGYSKAAPVADLSANHFGFQTSPFLHRDYEYHRSTSSLLLDRVNATYAKELRIKEREMALIHSPRIKELFVREMPNSGLETTIDSTEKFEALIDQLLEDAKSNKFPENKVLIDFTALLKQMHLAPSQIRKEIVKPWEKILARKIKTFVKANPSVHIEQLISEIHLIGFTKYHGENILLIPEFLLDPHLYTSNNCSKFVFDLYLQRHSYFLRELDSLISRHGYRLGTIQAKQAWLKIKSGREILTELNFPQARLATKGDTIPRLCWDFETFMEQPIIKKFSDLANSDNPPPYLSVLSQATIDLLRGLSEIKKNGQTVDEIFEKKKISPLLQVSYFRMQNAMNEAIFRKDDFVGFMNQIELIHQEIQMILAVVNPHDEDTLSDSVREKLTSGPSPVISATLPQPSVYAKNSAMHCLSNIVGGVEAQKNGDSLTIMVLEDCYYEETWTLGEAKRHDLHKLNGDVFNTNGGSIPIPAKPVDLFIAEFHHNISITKKSYKSENLIGQIKAMLNQGIVADKFTVALDTTIDLEQSDQLRALLADPEIQKLINDGKMNVVFFRSAQKFDMMGMDNYYGGIAASINDGHSFALFNESMGTPEDQLSGLSYQGLAHLQKYGGRHLDSYRQTIMNNTRLLYNSLPKEAIYSESSANPMQISEIQDDRSVFLDIKFPNHPKTAGAFRHSFLNFAYNKNLPLTSRSSFGFTTTNFTIIQQEKFRLNPGLDGKETIDQYASFFRAVQECIDTHPTATDAQ